MFLHILCFYIHQWFRVYKKRWLLTRGQGPTRGALQGGLKFKLIKKIKTKEALNKIFF